MLEFHVEDMTCGHCASTITKAVKAVDADAVLHIDVPSHAVRIESATGAGKFEAAIREAGYTPIIAK